MINGLSRCSTPVVLSIFSVFIAFFGVLSAAEPQETSEETAFDRFRIDNVMTIRKEGEEKGMQIVTTTLFGEGMVIDFIGDNDEVIIYYRKIEKFVLLDPIHRVQTELPLSEIDQFITTLRGSLAEKKDPHSRFLLNPDFEITHDSASGEISFASKWYEYLIATRSFDDPQMSEVYFEFIDVYNKLNFYMNPGLYTPMARTAINDLLSRQGRFPAKIRLYRYPKGKRLFAKPEIITSEHKIIRRLSEEDLGRIIRAQHFAAQFPKKTFGNYYKTVSRMQP